MLKVHVGMSFFAPVAPFVASTVMPLNHIIDNEQSTATLLLSAITCHK